MINNVFLPSSVLIINYITPKRAGGLSRAETPERRWSRASAASSDSDSEEENELRHWMTKVKSRGSVHTLEGACTHSRECARLGSRRRRLENILASSPVTLAGWRGGQSGEFTGIVEVDGESESRPLEASDL